MARSYFRSHFVPAAVLFSCFAPEAWSLTAERPSPAGILQQREAVEKTDDSSERDVEIIGPSPESALEQQQDDSSEEAVTSPPQVRSSAPPQPSAVASLAASSEQMPAMRRKLGRSSNMASTEQRANTKDSSATMVVSHSGGQALVRDRKHRAEDELASGERSGTDSTAKVASESNPPCYDNDVNCIFWSSEGYCEDDLYFAYMKQDCKHSCGWCVSTPTMTTTPAVPEKLAVLSVHGQTKVTGLYVLVPAIHPYDQPVWKSTSNPYWLYPLAWGGWGIGGLHAYEEGLISSYSHVYCPQMRNKKTPDELACVWKYWSQHSGWVPDPHIMIKRVVKNDFVNFMGAEQKNVIQISEYGAYWAHLRPNWLTMQRCPVEGECHSCAPDDGKPCWEGHDQWDGVMWPHLSLVVPNCSQWKSFTLVAHGEAKTNWLTIIYWINQMYNGKLRGFIDGKEHTGDGLPSTQAHGMTTLREKIESGEGTGHEVRLVFEPDPTCGEGTALIELFNFDMQVDDPFKQCMDHLVCLKTFGSEPNKDIGYVLHNNNQAQFDCLTGNVQAMPDYEEQKCGEWLKCLQTPTKVALENWLRAAGFNGGTTLLQRGEEHVAHEKVSGRTEVDMEACIDPKHADAEGIHCECYSGMQAQCEKRNATSLADCFRELMCESPKICASWKTEQGCAASFLDMSSGKQRLDSRVDGSLMRRQLDAGEVGAASLVARASSAGAASRDMDQSTKAKSLEDGCNGP